MSFKKKQILNKQILKFQADRVLEVAENAKRKLRQIN